MNPSIIKTSREIAGTSPAKPHNYQIGKRLCFQGAKDGRDWIETLNIADLADYNQDWWFSTTE
jgi:hypothetical protein